MTTCTTYKNAIQVRHTGTAYKFLRGRTGAVTARARWWALTAVSLATLMTYLDNNVINVAIPTIQHSLHLSVSGLEWIVSSYLLVLAGLLLAGGRVADIYGRRRIFLAGLVIFTLSSLAAGLAGSGGFLIGARAVQGLGGGAADAGGPRDHHACLHRRQGADDGDRRLGRRQRARPRARPGDRRRHQPARALGMDLPHQRSARGHHVRDRGPVRPGIRERKGNLAGSTYPGSSSRRSRCSHSPTR